MYTSVMTGNFITFLALNMIKQLYRKYPVLLSKQIATHTHKYS